MSKLSIILKCQNDYFEKCSKKYFSVKQKFLVGEYFILGKIWSNNFLG